VKTSSVTGPKRSSKALPKAKLAPKKCHGHWWSAGLIYYIFLNPGETIISEKIHNKSLRYTKNCNATSVKRKGPLLLHDNTQPHITQPELQKLKKLG